MRSIKTFVKAMVHHAGYEVIRRPKPQANTYPFKDIPYSPNTVDLGAYSRNYSTESMAQRRFYNIGAGSFRHQYWTNIDLLSDWYRDQQQTDNQGLINFDLFSLGRMFPSSRREGVSGGRWRFFRKAA